MSLFESLIISLPADEIRLKPEDEEGFVEYKLRLDTKNKFGLQKMISQMNWRLDIGYELLGRREAHYVLGINDDGTLGKLTESEIDDSFKIFCSVVEKNNVTITHIDKKKYQDFFLIYCIIKKLEKEKIQEINVAFVGPSQHGKTTTISHIAYGQRDDGNGYARRLVLKHEHEKNTGLTSSIKKEIIGIKKSKIVNYSTGIQSCWENIVRMSDHIINLIDLPGDPKFIKTTLFGLTAYKIDALGIVVNINKLDDETFELISFYVKCANIMNISSILILTHCDNDNDLEVNKNLLPINTNFAKISNLTDMGMNLIEDFLCSLCQNQKTPIVDKKQNTNNIFSIIETYFVPDSGIIFSGIMDIGSLSIGQQVFLTNGKINKSTKIISIYKKQINSQNLYEGETGTIQLEAIDSKFLDMYKHAVLSTEQMLPQNFFCFREFVCLNLQSHIQNPMLFTGNNVGYINMTLSNQENEQKIYECKTEDSILNKKNYAFIKTQTVLLFGTLFGGSFGQI